MALPSLRGIIRGRGGVGSLPVPRYLADAPKVGADRSLDHLLPLVNPLTLAAAATSEEALSFVADLIERLTPSEEIAGQHAFYRLALAHFGQYWRYADLTTTLWAAAKFILPTSYLEIGVRRGRSAAVVGALRPECAIYGFDLWVADYAGVPNPGPDFVRGELKSVGHRGEVVLVSGDSRETVPDFLREQPDLFFDLITVDGDHSSGSAATDLANVLPRLKIGGIVVLDDICMAPALGPVWEEIVRRDRRYRTWEFTDAAYGVAAAVRTRQ